MTQEEKAKAYDEAFETARKLNSGEGVEAPSGWTVCEVIFPKLRESEDEKIRKELINFLQLPHQQFVGERKQEEWISWLEKQGESIKIKKGKNYLCTKTHKYAGIEWIEGIKYYSPEDYSLVNQGCTCYCPKYSKEEHNNFFKEVGYDGCFEKQSKEEYALKSFKHEDVCKFVQYIEKEAKAYDFDLPHRSYDIYGFAKDIFAWFEKQSESKPKKVPIWKHWDCGIAGGSEHEQIFLVKIGSIYSISSCLGCECDYIELSELDELMRDEGKSKWTEEDEKMLKEIISDVKFEGYNNDIQAKSYKKMEWLKSLKQRMEK